MNEEILHSIREEIRETIKTVVNGKIDHLKEIIDAHNMSHELDMVMVRKNMEETKAHIEEVKPILQGLNGAKLLGTGLKWLAGVGVAWIALRAILTGNPIP